MPLKEISSLKNILQLKFWNILFTHISSSNSVTHFSVKRIIRCSQDWQCMVGVICDRLIIAYPHEEKDMPLSWWLCIPINNQLDAQFLIYIYIYLFIYLFRFSTCFEQPCAHHQESQLYQYIICYTGCPRRNVPDFGRVFLMLNYTDITQNTYIQSWRVTEIMAREVWNFDSCYSLTDYQTHIETGRNMWFL